MIRLPALKLEKLSGDRAGQWSIRINDPWRLGSVGICAGVIG